MNLGHLDISIGWPAIQSTAVLSGNVVDLVVGEWKGATGKPSTLMLVGLLLLVVGIAVIE
ncbi:MAG TPA: L-rhamnose/proton symporter RhaT [bacterium]|nr:L-rhamnose/proton symporter RhaT [bacterium]HPN35471.1 L-rhamnose/proton symporter RhaT [bacterium]